MDKLVVLIPCYNEGKNIVKVVDKLSSNCPQFDYIIINDGSKDNTAEICRKSGFPMIDLPVNLGLLGGIQAGMKYAERHDYDYVLQFDGDGQHNPEYIADMLAEMQAYDLDFVIGSRFVSSKKPKNLRMFGSNLIQFVLFMTTGKKIYDPTSGMRLYCKRLISIMANALDFGPEPDTIAHFIRSGARFKEVQVDMNERVIGESYLSFTRAMRYMVHIFMSILFFQWFRKKLDLGRKVL
jgi:glycosyltransferase involved in cell wall biosynthesis